ncbi:bifunctional phosphopantothenoylcysteine decarboxylase/phosphopantothenate--cysteine ligase CoaBC [Candidatus Microgenomates bacterium]|nr:MAG: bifunctional phosphopantothenoylcysteine decarboxylase/phosphopantothenate--cysteine ligase CoaBC [Candidatus Microgenomates bacterium]
MKKTIILGVTGSIAAYKALKLIELLKKDEIDVFVVMTKSAKKIIEPSIFEKASGKKIYTKLFENGFDPKKVLKERKVGHIELAKKASLMVIAPATANTIAKLANGFADDYLTTVALAFTSQIIICPAMNSNMWENQAVSENINKLKSRGLLIIEPTCGELACGSKGNGRLEDVDIIKDEILRQLNRTTSFKGKKIIVTAGGTIEKIDEIRYITNRSSGKMGARIAEECFLRGANVLLLRAKNAVKPNYLIKEKTFSTSEDLLKLIRENIKDSSIIFHSAAVSDFQVGESFKGKISSNQNLVLKLKPREKIINSIKIINPKIKLIAFKAEYGLAEKEMIEKAKATLKKSNSDAIIVNDISRTDRGFESDNNEVFVILQNGEKKQFSLSTKKEIAKNIVDYLSKTFV